MNKLQSIIAYFCMHYPYSHELSNARLTKLVYLADWFSSLLDNKQITNIHWLFNHYGPYVSDVIESADPSLGFNVVQESTMYGTQKVLVSFIGDNRYINLSEREQQILDAVIGKTKSMYFNDFIQYVYSTYPVSASERYASLDLVTLANRFKAEKAEQPL